MNSKALINETLKYLEKNKNGTPKYRFDIYRRGSNPEPVRIYTVGDLFDTLTGIKGGILENVSALRSRLNNIKVSLEQLGFTSLNTTINMMLTAIVPIETIQTIEKAYRVVRPLSEKIADIASIYFHFSYASLIVQDVLQYLTRLAVQTARNYLQKLWNAFLTTPVFAIYEITGDTVNLAEVYSLISTEANKMLDGLVSDKNAFNTIVNFINTSTDQRMNWPKYGELGIVSPYPIKDVYHDPDISNIIVAAYDEPENKSYLYSLSDDYTLKEFYSVEGKKIQRVYLYRDDEDNEAYYITNNNTITRIKTDGTEEVLTIPGANLGIIFSDPILLYSANKIYTATGEEITDLDLPANEAILFQCYNNKEDYIYAIVKDVNENYHIYAIGKNSEDEYIKEDLGTLDSEPYGITYFNDTIFVTFKDSNDKYYLVKIKSAISFDRDEYNFALPSIGDESVLWTNGKFATNGSLIYETNGSDLKLINSAPESINSIIQTNYNGNDYFICSGGISLYSSLIRKEKFYGNNDIIALNWNQKIINFTDSKNVFSPDNMAGCVWYKYKDNKENKEKNSFLAYSHKNIFFLGDDKVGQIFQGVEQPDGPEKLAYKEKASFSSYWSDKKESSGAEIIHYSSKVSAPANCIITCIRAINGNLYIAFYNPNYVNETDNSLDNLTSGVYRAYVNNDPTNNTSYDWNGVTYYYGNYSLVIDYDRPVFTVKNRKIYSFDYISDHWYYTDGQTLYDATNNFGIDLDLNNELDPDSKMSKYYELDGDFEKTTIDLTKTYYVYNSELDSYIKVENPVTKDAGLYYELTGEFSKIIDLTKTYYVYNSELDSYIKVENPVAEDASLYYELDGTFEKTSDTTIDLTKTYYAYSEELGSYVKVANPVVEDIDSYYELNGEFVKNALDPDKTYYVYNSELESYVKVKNPVVENIGFYYELDGVFKKIALDPQKTYYYYDSSFDSYLKVDNPVIEDISLYYELNGSFEKTGDASVNSSKTYYVYNKRLDSFIKVSNPNKAREYDGALYIDDINNNIVIYTSKALLTSVTDKKVADVKTNVDYKSTNIPQIASTPKTVMFSDGQYIYNIIDTKGYKINYDLFQMCYIKGVYDYNLIQSNQAVFIISDNVIKKVPINSFITSSNYGCGYYTDTTLNEWYGAAPYYFASNVLNENQNKTDRNIYIASFYENFKVELEKLLKNIPNAFVNYTKNRLKDRLAELGVTVENDDGQITSFIIDSVSSVSANSIGMYIQQKFYERIGDDSTYKIFADSVYEACKADQTNNMTKDFYDIFEALYYSIIEEALIEKNVGDDMATYLLRYYQNHKAEWAKSMTDLIDIDKVKEEDYEIPLNVTYTVSETTYTFNYLIDNYEFDYKNNIIRNRLSDNVISGYAKKDGEKIVFYSDPEYTKEIDKRTRNSEGDYYEDGSLLCYYDSENEKFYKYKIEDYVLSEDTEVNPDKTYYERTGDNTYIYTLTSDTEEEDKQYFELGYQLTSDTEVVTGKNYYKQIGGDYVYSRPGSSYYNEDGSLKYQDENGNIINYYEEKKYFKTEDISVDSGKTYYNEYYIQATGEVDENTQYYSLQYEKTTDISLDLNKIYFEKVDYSKYSGDLYTPFFKITEDSEIVSGKTYYTCNELTGTYTAVVIPKEDELRNYYETVSNDTGIQRYSRTFVEVSELDRYNEYYEKSLERVVRANIDPENTYYEKSGDVYTAVENPIQADIGKYYLLVNDEYILAIGERINSNNTYYTYNSDTGTYTEVTNPVQADIGKYYSYVYTLVYEPNIADGPFYVVDSFEQNPNGEYYVVPNTGEVVYSIVLNPSVDGLVDYYEPTYGTIKTPDSLTDGIFKKEFAVVDNPNDVDITNYFEKSDTGYIIAEDVEYVYKDGEIYGIVNDRTFFLSEFEEVSYELVIDPSGNPALLGYYEVGYTPVKPNTFVNPSAEGYYERTLNAISFSEVIDPSGSPVEHGWFEYVPAIFSTEYIDNRIYKDLDPIEIDADFDAEDSDWHDVFYDEVENAKNSLDFEEELTQLKKDAIVALNKVHYVIYPSWKWQELITKAVTEFYIPIQGEQYRTIVNESNMYPIQWNELPSNINQNAFDLALTTLLNEIKKRLNMNISLLVDNGMVKCYSCVDASTVIRKMVEKNGSVWMNQLRTARKRVDSASSKEEVENAFSMIKTFNPSRYMLKIILDAQSALYAKYIDKIIEEQIINDYETEVSMELYESYASGTTES